MRGGRHTGNFPFATYGFYVYAIVLANRYLSLCSSPFLSLIFFLYGEGKRIPPNSLLLLKKKNLNYSLPSLFIYPCLLFSSLLHLFL